MSAPAGEARSDLRAALEDGIRIGIGLGCLSIDELLTSEELIDEARDALAGVRDALRELSAEFTLTDSEADA